MNLREAAQKALDALSDTWTCPKDQPEQFQREIEAMQAIEAALAQPEQEPVAWMSNTNRIYRSRIDAVADGEQLLNPLYSAPPQREWQGLTDEEYEMMAEHYVTNCYFDTLKYARAIEAKLKEKNS